ncbi:MAG: hypothetical protein J6A22_07050 [Bacteroidales bacterium]|nr:hypothetical protein [Bacteroidales bacterium]
MNGYLILLFSTFLSLFPVQASETSTKSGDVLDSAEVHPLRHVPLNLPACRSLISLTYTEAKASQLDITESSLDVAMPLSSVGDTVEYHVGSIPYGEDVTPTGARVYTVPLMTSPLSKFPPTVSLMYNSQSGDGAAGYGWHIGGLSSIILTGHNIYYHGRTSPASVHDPDPAFSLDGVPLVTNDDPSTSGTYPLETASGHILVKVNRSAGTVTHFNVLYPDGRKAVFGLESNTSARSFYPVTCLEDKFGNYIEYSYYSTYSDYRLSRITYGHRAHTSHLGTLEFGYSVRTGSHVRYRAGEPSTHSHLLKSILCKSRGETLCLYSLDHEYRNGDFLLSRVRCRDASGAYLRPLEFTYGSPDIGSTVPADDFTPKGSLFMGSYFDTDNTINYIRGKFIEDSFSDGLLIYPAFEVYAPLNSSNTLFGSMYSPEQEAIWLPSLSEPVNNAHVFTLGSGFQYLNAADVDNDGKDDIVKVNHAGISASSTTLRITVMSPVTSGSSNIPSRTFDVEVNGTIDIDGNLSPMQRTYNIGDYLGNGYKQLLTTSSCINPVTGETMSSCTSLIDLNSGVELSEEHIYQLSMNDRELCVDLDGDGRTELCHIGTAGMKTYNMDGSRMVLTGTHTLPTGSLLERGFHIADFNGDGYADFLIEPASSTDSWTACLYTGHEFLSSQLQLSGKEESDRFMFFDLNKDGLSDLVRENTGSLYIYINDRCSLSAATAVTSSVTVNQGTALVQNNLLAYGSMSDFVTVTDARIGLYAYGSDLSEERLLTGMVNSLGKVSVNQYMDMSTDDAVYIADTTLVYNPQNGYKKTNFPLKLLYMSQSCVSQSEILDYTSYSYSGACTHSMGLGFCGFGKIREIHLGGGASSETPVTLRKFDPQRMGVTTRIQYSHLSSQNSPYRYVEYTYDNHSTLYGRLNPRLVRENSHDNLSTLSSVTTYAYDSYGFPVSTNESRTIGGNTHSATSRTITYSHSTSPASYILGNVRQSTTTVSTSVGSTWTERRFITYDDRMMPLSCVDSVGINVMNLKRIGESRWTYDSYGNILTEMSAPYEVTQMTGKTYEYSVDGTCLTRVTDALGLTITYSGHDRFGNPSAATDYRSRRTEFGYDGWGNKVLTRHPDGSTDSLSMSWGGTGVYQVMSHPAGEPSSVTHYDAAGRKVRTGSRRFDGQWIYQDIEYDHYGNVSRESLPFRGNATPGLWNTYGYDKYMRPVSHTLASGNVTTWEYSGNSTVETRNGIRSKKTVDTFGNVIKVEDPGGTIRYTLRADGSPVSIQYAEGATTDYKVLVSMTYDRYVRRTSITDVSAGVRTDSLVFNPDGSSVSWHTNPNGQIITFSDRFGRVTRVERPGEYNTDYTYGYGGLLTSEVSSNGTSKTYQYDNHDRLYQVLETVPDGKWLRKSYSYGNGGNVASITYHNPSGMIATEEFSYAYGTNHLISIQGTPVRRIDSENSFGMPIQVTTGSVIRTYSYSQYGLPTRRTMGQIMDWSYSFDTAKGNLTARTDNCRNITENFTYDGLNRLKGMDDRRITYSANGNITMIDDVGSFKYRNKAVSPYQVTDLELDGDAMPSRLQEAQYTCYNRPSIIEEGGRSAAFTYNGDGDRVKMNVSDGATSVLTRYYIGNQYEMDVTPTGTTERLYLGGDAYSAPMVYIKEGSENWTLYNIGRDYLGNITHIATSDGTLVEENSYDPWGRLRNPETKEIYSLGTEPELMLGRGYTGHEHLTWFGLINMNARLYDPVLGRFLSPDPFIQMPDFTQNFNRYSYCLNNPLVYVDKNGELVFTTAIIVGICVSAAIGVGIGIYEGYKIAEKKGLEGSAKTWTIIGGGLIGGVAGGASALVGAYVGAGMVAAEIGGFYAGAATGGAAGATAGLINGFGLSTLETGDPLYGAYKGLDQGVRGFYAGAITGGLLQGASSILQGKRFLDGSTPTPNTIEGSLTPYEKGQQGVEMAIKQVTAEGGVCRGKEVTVRVNDTKVRFDFIADVDGQMTFFEVKNGPHAGFTPNQKIVYPDMLLNKPMVYPVGRNAHNIFVSPTNNYNFVIIKFNF